MTARDQALTNTEKNNALGMHTIVRYLFPVANSIVATAQINQSAFTFPVAFLTIDNVTLGWVSLVAPGMTVLVGSTPGASDIGIYRVRPDTITTTSLPISETSEGDPGLVPIGIRLNTFNDNQYITIVANSNFFSIIPLITGGSVYEDYNRTDYIQNSFPSPMVYILCDKEHNHIAKPVDAGQTYATIVFVASFDLFPTSSSAVYLWDVPASWTITAGGVTTNTITCRVPRNGIANDVLRLLVAENNGFTQRRIINVWVYEKTGTYAPIIITDMSEDSWDNSSGYSATLTLNDDLLTQLPNGCMAMIKDELTFNGQIIDTACDQFVGWLVRSQQSATATDTGAQRQADIELIGPSGLLDRRRGMSQVWSVNDSQWEFAPATVLSLSYAQWWILKVRAWGVLENFDVNLSALGVVGQRIPTIIVNNGSLWKQLQDLTDGNSKRVIACDPDGTFWVLRRPSLILYSDRASNCVERDIYTTKIIHDYNFPAEQDNPGGWVQGGGFVWNGTAAIPTPLLTVAPGSAPGQGPADDVIQNQVVASQNDLDILLGQWFPYINPDYSQGVINHKGNRGALLKPAQQQFIRVQIPANKFPLNVDFDRRFIPAKVRRSFSRGADGISLVVDTEITPDIETGGLSGETVPIPGTNDNLYGVTPVLAPPVSSSTADAAFGLFAGVNDLGAINSDGYIYRTHNLKSLVGGPLWDRASLGVSGTPVGGVPNPYCTRYKGGAPGTEVDSFVVTTTGIYSVLNVQGTPAATLRKTFSGTTALRSIQISFGTQYMISVSSTYSNGVYETHSTNGTSWSAEVLIGAADPGTVMPGCAVSSRNPGTIYSSGMTGAATADGFGSINSGASYSALSNPNVDLGVDLAGDILLPYNINSADKIVYHGKQTGSGSVSLPTTFDFTVSDHGFAADPVAATGSCGAGIGNGLLGGSYGGASGWQSTTFISWSVVWITLDTVSPINITSFEYIGSTTGPTAAQPQLYVYIPGLGGWQCGLVGSNFMSGSHVSSGSQPASYTGVTKLGFFLFTSTGSTVALEQVILGGSGTIGTPAERKLIAVNATAATDVSPIVSGTKYGPWQSRQIDADGSNRSLMVAALGNSDQSLAGIFASMNGFASNVSLVAPVAPGSRYERCAISSDGTRTVYAFGTNGVIGVSSGFAPVTDRRGNLPSFSPGTFLNIMGL